MSAYPSYSQAPSTSGYYQQPAPSAQSGYQQYQGYYQQSAAPPFSVPYNDEQYFRHDYARRLTALTFNSRPLIQELSILAQTYSQTMSRGVIESIEQQLRMAPAEHKLPTFYLLDSILKNCPEPYIGLATPIIHRLFLDVYNSVDETTRTKMREMLVTWRTGLTGGAPVFQNAILDMIERGVYDGSYRNNGPRKPTPQQVWTELEVVFSTKERMARENPHDEVTRKHLEILNQLRTMVPKMSPDELTSVLTRLREMARSSSAATAPPPPPPPPPSIHPQPASYPPPTAFPIVPSAPAPYALPSVPAAPAPSQYASLLQSLGLSNQAALPAAVPVATAPTIPLVNSANLSALLSTLQGRLGSALHGAVAPNVALPEPKQPPTDPSKMTQQEYEDRILSFRIGTATSELLRTKPQILPFLYVKSAPQCSECGMRFPAVEHGKQLLRDHLDQHFRQNVKANENIGRGTSRSWFVGRQNWVSDVPELAGNKLNSRSGCKQSEKAKAEAAVQLRKGLEAKVVVVPLGSEGKSATCRICMEDIPIEFDEDEEQWVWRNAVMQGEKVYHATCHYDISKRRESKLTASGSRQGTPDVGMITPPKSRLLMLGDGRAKSDSPKPASRTTPPKRSPLAGTKRKQGELESADILNVEGINMVIKQESIDERPLKRVAIELPIQVTPSRIETDVMKLLMSNFEVTLVDDSVREFHVMFHGPKETAYEGGVWKIHVELPEQYPYKSPSIGFVNKIFHPNIDETSGSVCLDVINQTWSPMFDMMNIFEVFLPQLLRYPNAADPLNGDAAALQMRDPAAYEAKVKDYVKRFASNHTPTDKGEEKKPDANVTAEEEEDCVMSDVSVTDEEDN